MNTEQTIRALGFRGAGDLDVRRFQQAWNLGPALTVDGVIGPKTAAAAAECAAKDGRLSEHFRAEEFWCGCGGKKTGCQVLLVRRQLLRSLESLRAVFYPGGLSIVSGYRCAKHNTAVGGAAGSHHMDGTAADVPGVATLGRLKPRQWFAGYGCRSKADPVVVHVDRRDILAGATRTTVSPAVWYYG